MKRHKKPKWKKLRIQQQRTVELDKAIVSALLMLRHPGGLHAGIAILHSALKGSI